MSSSDAPTKIMADVDARVRNLSAASTSVARLRAVSHEPTNVRPQPSFREGAERPTNWVQVTSSIANETKHALDKVEDQLKDTEMGSQLAMMRWLDAFGSNVMCVNCFEWATRHRTISMFIFSLAAYIVRVEGHA